MAEGVRLRHAVLRSAAVGVRVPDYGPNRVVKTFWLQLDGDGCVIVTEPTLSLLLANAPGEWEKVNTVLHPPTQGVSGLAVGAAAAAPGATADERLRAQQQAALLAEWRDRQTVMARAVTEIAPPGATRATVTVDGIDPTTQRQRITVTG